MLAQRAVQQSLRRLAVQHHALKLTAPVAIATGNAFRVQRRLVAATTVDPKNILAQQRLKRPTSPHLGIYRPQITWYLSILNRITGALMSGGFYLFGTAYLIAPYAGWHLESASIAAAFASWPAVAKILTKFVLAFPFTFHSFNGVRHLVWDMGSAMTNAAVNQTGWTVVALSTASALALAFM